MTKLSKPESLQFKPYARLLTMLGEQLIKNERIALVEVIKNSYDADASWVKVTFENFTDTFEAKASSKIIIEDDGAGMTRHTITQHWVNPATPIKLIGKKAKKHLTPLGRIVQGEKGIGRFALLKLGKTITVITRPEGENTEYKLHLDLSPYDSDFIPDGSDPLFLDQITLSLSEHLPEAIVPHKLRLGTREVNRKPHGTRIEISHLETPWSQSKVEKVYSDLIRLQSIFIPSSLEDRKKNRNKNTDHEEGDSFDVSIFLGSKFQPFSEVYKNQLSTLIEQNSVFRIEEGRYDEDKKCFKFLLNGVPKELRLSDPEITGMTMFRKAFGKEGEKFPPGGTSCGSFSFAFFVFDFDENAKGPHKLDADDKVLIRQHRIYLYRDGIRVYPYGDPEDDWLGIDIYRGTVKASELLSNDQVVGYVDISQEHNPSLQDKTNREGLIDNGNATAEFIQMLRLVLAWIRSKPYAIYRASLATSKEVEIFKKQEVQQAMDDMAASAPEVKEKIAALAKLYQAERKYLVRRAETTEHLAGVGLSVETASHDLMTVMIHALSNLDGLMAQCRRKGELDKETVYRDLSTIRGMLSFVQQQIKDLQLLFKSSKQRRKDIRVKEVVEKVIRLFASALDKDKIEVVIEETRSPLIAKTTDAVLLQLFLNLFDNSIYWLKSVASARKILITLNGDDGELIVSDNGPGVSRDDAPYIFDAFFSGKGEDGRGLGLYIARQLLDRHEYTINLADLKAQKRLRGANFVVSFIKDEQ